MEQIDSLTTLSPMISSQWKRGVLTNAPFTADGYEKEISAGTLYAHEIPGGLILLRRRADFDRLYFYLQPDADLTAWTPQRTTVLEIPARSTDTALKDLGQLWESRGFLHLFSRHRILCRSNTGTAPADNRFTIRAAQTSEQERISEIMNNSFDVRTACLPTPEELRADIEAGHVLVAAAQDGTVAGLLRFERSRRTVEARQLAVCSEYRGCHIGGDLLSAYHRIDETLRHQLWVRDDNTPARKFYDKFGYEADGWTSSVWLYDKERN